QYGGDLYNLTVSQNQVRQSVLALKQLLELDLDDDLDIRFPDLESLHISREVPALHIVYYKALETMPEIKAAESEIASATLNEKVAKAGRLPSITFSAAVGTGYYSSADFAFLNQLNNNINENISLGIRIPIYQRREAKSAVDKAVLQTRRSELDLQMKQKDLLATIENLHQNAVAAQERYKAAELQMEASRESYELMREQYQAGLSTLVDMFSEKNNFVSATGEMLKAKYQAVLSLCLLNFYQNEPILF
ncbi:MAG: TolC family protein, partial [Bacteroidales bacterium]|nr:TolC family protein [Bacteroidales bacterium]